MNTKLLLLNFALYCFAAMALVLTVLATVIAGAIVLMPPVTP